MKSSEKLWGTGRARAKAEGSRVRLAISNPCFELWLALHFADQTAWLDNDDAGKLRRKHDKRSDKGLDGSQYMPRRADAAQRARALTAKHAGDGREFPKDNPSSGMYLLLEAIESRRVSHPPVVWRESAIKLVHLVTTAIRIGDGPWLGSYPGDRLACLPVPE